MRNELLSMIEMRSGHFRLESGHHGDLWLDLDSLFRRPSRLRPAVTMLAQRLAAHDIEMVCGPLSGGAFVAQLVAVELDVEFCYTERTVAPRADAMYSAEYRVPSGFSVTGCRVAVVDDVVNAGSAVRATLASLDEAQAEPVAIGALLMLGRSAVAIAAEQELSLESVARLDNALWAPEDCPMCAEDMPLDDNAGRAPTT
ncbi:phosphoribosyltransferase family protein [Nocardia iowensis]|uniref:Phosphoribosyltransferase domain-containing protein n=1 Tax=Nocardia iowensis TaxID=204891 RepID=A0ABX8RXL3_NOCIO|nr:phosphoribosyltransferase family protein [Nocardia iowensis]QXN94398.1 hypothetical protein KV110_15860 [Nocardia iowensis]